MITCEKCSHQCRDDARFCEACGTRLGPGACPKCNAKIEGSPAFCDQCGFPLRKVAAPESSSTTTERVTCETCAHFRPAVPLSSLVSGTRSEEVQQVIGQQIERESKLAVSETDLRLSRIEAGQTEWPHEPQMSSYCAQALENQTWFICEMKNSEGNCGDHEPADQVPAHPCLQCNHRIALVDPVTQIDPSLSLKVHHSHIKALGAERANELRRAFLGRGYVHGQVRFYDVCPELSDSTRTAVCVMVNRFSRCMLYDGQELKPLQAPKVSGRKRIVEIMGHAAVSLRASGDVENTVHNLTAVHPANELEGGISRLFVGNQLKALEHSDSEHFSAVRTQLETALGSLEPEQATIARIHCEADRHDPYRAQSPLFYQMGDEREPGHADQTLRQITECHYFLYQTHAQRIAHLDLVETGIKSGLYAPDIVEPVRKRVTRLRSQSTRDHAAAARDSSRELAVIMLSMCPWSTAVYGELSMRIAHGVGRPTPLPRESLDPEIEKVLVGFIEHRADPMGALQLLWFCRQNNEQRLYKYWEWFVAEANEVAVTNANYNPWGSPTIATAVAEYFVPVALLLEGAYRITDAQFKLLGSRFPELAAQVSKSTLSQLHCLPTMVTAQIEKNLQAKYPLMTELLFPNYTVKPIDSRTRW